MLTIPTPAGFSRAPPHSESTTINSEQLTSLLRTVLQFAGGFAVGRGLVDAKTMTTIVCALVTILVTVWSLYARRNAGLVASAAAVPDVQTIAAAPALAEKVPAANVVPARGS